MKYLLTIFWICILSTAQAETPKPTLVLHAISVGQYQLSMSVPKDHHAYLNEGSEAAYLPVDLSLDETASLAGFKLQNLHKPAGVYDAAVKAFVLRDKGEFSFTLHPITANTRVQLVVKYQLCNELTNVCYRPQTIKLDIPLNVALPTESGNFTDNLTQSFEKYKKDSWILFGLMLIAGLLSVATPCVYPMLPITSMFIVNRAGGEVKAEKLHAMVYLLGMVCTYMLLGLIAGMTGGAFNALMQSAIMNIAFALFFAFFALALLGFYELSFLQSEVCTLDQHSAQVKGLSGTWLMGGVAGLVISPCVGPIVFSLLLQVADNIAEKSAALVQLNQTIGFWDKFVIASQGSFMMAGFGLGVGLPFFLISVIKFKKLPRSGYWMNKVKYAFGFIILYFAYLYLMKGLGVLGVETATGFAMMIGLVSIWIAVVHCNLWNLLPEDASPGQKLHRFIGVIAFLVGAWLIVVSLGQMPFLHAQTLTHTTTPQMSTVQQEAGIMWYRNFQAAKNLAKQTGKPLFIDFYASWCANCIAFKEETATNTVLNQALREKAIAVKLVDKEPDFEAFRELPAHRQLKIGLPYFAILDPDGQLIWSGTDYKATDQMVAMLSR